MSVVFDSHGPFLLFRGGALDNQRFGPEETTRNFWRCRSIQGILKQPRGLNRCKVIRGYFSERNRT